MSDASDEPRLTRRGLLGGIAAAGAAVALGRSAAVAAALGPPVVFSQWVGGVMRRSGELAVPRPFTLAGVEWATPRSARIELRARAHGGVWSRWGVASTLGHGPDKPASNALIGEAVWTGPADFVELRSSHPLQGVRLHFVSVGQPSTAAYEAAAPVLAQPVLDAGPGQPPVIGRAAWAGTHTRLPRWSRPTAR